MKAWLFKIQDRNRRIIATIIVMLLVVISLTTTGIISALCDLSAFVILLTVLWLQQCDPSSQNKSHN